MDDGDNDDDDDDDDDNDYKVVRPSPCLALLTSFNWLATELVGQGSITPALSIRQGGDNSHPHYQLGRPVAWSGWIFYNWTNKY